MLDAVSTKFSGRHQQIGQFFKERFRQLREVVSLDQDLSEQRQLLIGAYFVSEFSVESAALFNPSTVADPDQQGLPPGALRFVFLNDHRTYIYFATFTAFDGQLGIPQLLETSDFLLFRFATLNGPAVQNKGMALFPKKVNGSYAMLSRQDSENIYLMFSDNVYFWYEPRILLKPVFPWEMVQIGNCGSPIETKAGWLVLSHGVGPVREYSIGAFLLDLDDPSKVIGRLREPLLKPILSEWEGNVPNVTYSCGALLHDGELFIPYGVSDYTTRFATVQLNEVLAAMQ